MMDSDDKYAIAMVIISVVTVIGLTCLLMSCGNEINAAIDAANGAIEDTNRAIEDTNEQMAQDASPAIEHANGCPLDAVAYDTPAFADDGNKSLKVTDRFSGQSWWLVRMGAGWVVLPIDSEEADR